MSFDNTYTAVTGATYQASDYNTHTKGNFTAVWVGTTVGDMDYYTSASSKNRIALVTGGLLFGGAIAPTWLANVPGGVLYGGPVTPTHLPIGAADTFLRSTGSVPAYAPLVAKRQGGSATVWNSAGTTTYTPTATIIQTGCVSMTFASSTGNYTPITYPTAFTQAPTIFVSPECIFSLSFMWSVGTTQAADPTTGFNLNVKWASAYTGTINFSWLAIGQ